MTLPLTQRPSNRKTRGESSLPTILEKRLSAYAIAAGSAGVALLACAQASEAKVVVTKVDIAVPYNAGPINFDINGDGQNDFGLSAIAPGPSCVASHCGFKQLQVVPAQEANEVWLADTSYSMRCAADLVRGTRIDRLHPFAAGPLMMVATNGTSYNREFCNWRNGSPARPYLGVKFTDTTGKVHYGWVRVENKVTQATITAYAYETIPNKPILAGATTETEDEATQLPSNLPGGNELHSATLGDLALGASGISAWRREDEPVSR